MAGSYLVTVSLPEVRISVFRGQPGRDLGSINPAFEKVIDIIDIRHS